MTATVTKAELTKTVVETIGLEEDVAKTFVRSFFDTLVGAFLQGDQVKLSGFGNFCPRDKTTRPGRNPKTGQPVTIAARRVVTFLPGKKLAARTRLIAADGVADDEYSIE